jgi:hypothetical protein
MTITRQSAVLWFAAAGALVGYLAADGRPPVLWSYGDWLKFILFCSTWAIGKLQNSPLAGKADADSVSPRP